MNTNSEKKFDSFADLFRFSHSLRFPDGNAATGALAKSGLYDDWSRHMPDKDVDFSAMKEWLENNDLLSMTNYHDINAKSESEQKEIASGFIKAWEKYKLSFVAVRNKAWVNPFGIESSFVSSLAKDMSDETIERVFENSVLSKYCINEAKAARDSGIGIHQAYGSWRKMVEAFYEKEIESGLTETKKPQFVIQAKKLLNEENLIPEFKWREVAENHIIAEITPDHVYSIYEQIRKMPKGNDDLINDLYGKIFETPYRMSAGSVIVKADEVTYEVGKKVMINCSRKIGVIESIDNDSVCVISDEDYTLSPDGISLDVRSENDMAREIGA
jgi:hypothetical protein